MIFKHVDGAKRDLFNNRSFVEKKIKTVRIGKITEKVTQFNIVGVHGWFKTSQGLCAKCGLDHQRTKARVCGIKRQSEIILCHGQRS